MFLLKGLLTLSYMGTFLPWGRKYLGSVEASTLQGCGGRDGHSAGVLALLLNSFTTRIAPHKWLWLSSSRKNSQQRSKQVQCTSSSTWLSGNLKEKIEAVSRQSPD